MKRINIWIKKNGENLSDGRVFIVDEFGQPYILQPVADSYFQAQPDNLKRIAIVEVQNDTSDVIEAKNA